MAYVIGEPCIDVLDRACVDGAAATGPVGSDTQLVGSYPGREPEA